MCIIIFGDIFSFPEGNAATNRVHTYAKGFTKNGITTHVVDFGNTYDSNGDGIWNDIHYYHPFGTARRSNFFLARQIRKISKFARTIKLFRQLNKKEHIIAINIGTNLLSTHLFGWILAKICNSKLIIEGNEHPLRHYQQNVLLKNYGLLKMYIETYFSDGLFCISNYLIDFYKSKGISKQKLFLVPSTVDPGRFGVKGENPSPNPYIGYFGGLTFERDNIDLLIKAFAVISRKHPDLQLILGGFSSDSDEKQIVDLINKLNIRNRVQMLGYLEREEVTKYIVNAKILVMVRANNLEAKASFPSKLPEFLACAVPVISVNVGEIQLYVNDGINIYLVEPENIEALADKIEYVLSNYELAMTVGIKGKELTNTIFNYNYQANRMLNFIYSLK